MTTAALALWAAAVEVVQRPFFAIGFVGFVLMVPLAATSTVGMMRRVGGRRWQLVHRLVYPAAIASVVHTYWPLTTRDPRYGVILAVIFVLRFGRAYSFRERRT
jgi:sulfoxide reductase heme-binding subunit YedZ